MPIYKLKLSKSLPQVVVIINILIISIFYLIAYLLLPAIDDSFLFVKSNGFLLTSLILLLFSSLVFLFTVHGIYKKTIKKINNSETMIQRYEAVSAATYDAIWDHDLITGETFYNDRLYQIFGYTKQDTQNNTKWWADNIHPNDKKRVESKINFYFTTKKPFWEEEYRFKCKDGSYKFVYDRSYIIFGNNNKPLRLIGAMKDITNQKENEEKLLNLQLEQKNKIGKEIIMSNEIEKRKLKNELQEDINQILASVKLNINTANVHSFNSKDYLNDSIQQLTLAMSKIREITNQLYSSTFDFFGITAAISEILSEIENKFDTKTMFDYSAFNETPPQSEAHLLIFRVFQAYRDYSFVRKPAEISIRLYEKNNKNQLEIHDKGGQYDMMDSVNETVFQNIKNITEVYKAKIYIELSNDNEFNLTLLV